MEVEVPRFDPGAAVLAAVVELPALITEELFDVAVELVGGRLYIRLPRLAHEILRRIAVPVRHMVVLLVAPELADTPQR